MKKVILSTAGSILLLLITGFTNGKIPFVYTQILGTLYILSWINAIVQIIKSAKKLDYENKNEFNN